MIPIKFSGYDCAMGAPSTWNEERDGVCHPLPVKREHGNIISVWEPTDEERQQIAEGQNIILTCRGVQPPVTVTVADLQEPATYALRALLRSESPWEQPKLSLFARIKRAIFGARSTPDAVR